MADSQIQNPDQLAEIIGSAVARGIAQVEHRQIPIGEYDPKSPFHPNARTAAKLTRECFQNGTRLDPKRLHDDEIRLLNKIVTPGRYIQDLVEVQIINLAGGQQKLNLKYQNSRLDERIEQRAHWRNLKDLLQQIVDEQGEVDAAPAPAKARR